MHNIVNALFRAGLADVDVCLAYITVLQPVCWCKYEASGCNLNRSEKNESP